jgi:LysM repeat protein
VVKQGDTLSEIARKYGVARGAIRALNRLKKNELLKPGRTLAIPNPPGDNGPSTAERGPGETTPETEKQHVDWAGGVKGLVISGQAVTGGVRHTVQEGQTLAMIARAYYVDGKKLAKANGITGDNPLKAGQDIFIAGARRPVPVRTAAYSPHTVHLIRVRHTVRLKLKLINANGTLNRNSVNAIRRTLGYNKWMHPRLVDLLQRIAERFPGHTIDLLSGYRRHDSKKKKSRSPHSRGVAIDFRLQGVSNELLYEFISSLDKVGAGYYPNSIHVHIDVREKKHLWTDISGRGEPAIYVSPEDEHHWENVKDQLLPDETADTDSSEVPGESNG